MEKKTRTIGILLLVLLVLLITFFGLKKWNTSKSEAEEKKKEIAKTIRIMPNNASDNDGEI